MSLWFTWIGLAVAVEPNAPQDVEAAWGVPRDTPAWAALALDLDGDGLIELATVTHAPMYYGRMGADQRFTAAQDSPWGEQTADRHGMTACDVDRDGDFELIVASGGARGRGGNPAELWERIDGKWVNLGPDLFGVTGGARMRGVSCVDLDGDGDAELYFPAVGDPSPDMLLFRDANGRWTDEAEARGLSPSGDSVGGSFGDLNGDGRLDLVRLMDNKAQVLLQGPDGRFEPAQTQPDQSRVRDFALFDVDNDGDDDLWLARAWDAWDAARDGYAQLHLNKQDRDEVIWKLPKGCNAVQVRLQGTADGAELELLTMDGPIKVQGRMLASERFGSRPEGETGLYGWVDVEQRLLHIEAVGMQGGLFLGLACKDSDAVPKLISADIDPVKKELDVGDVLLINDGTGAFRPAPYSLPPEIQGYNTEGVLPFDRDLDGDLDLLLITGFSPGDVTNGPDFLLDNKGGGEFVLAPVWAMPPEEAPLEGHVGVVTDLNGDRYGDTIVFNGHHTKTLAGEAVSWQNPGGGGQWVEVRVFDAGGKARSLSAVVTIAPDAAPKQERLSNPSPGWRSNGNLAGVFGVGASKRIIVTVTWPDGETVTKRFVKPNTVVDVTHP